MTQIRKEKKKQKTIIVVELVEQSNTQWQPLSGLWWPKKKFHLKALNARRVSRT